MTKGEKAGVWVVLLCLGAVKQSLNFKISLSLRVRVKTMFHLQFNKFAIHHACCHVLMKCNYCRLLCVFFFKGTKALFKLYLNDRICCWSDVCDFSLDTGHKWIYQNSAVLNQKYNTSFKLKKCNFVILCHEVDALLYIFYCIQKD